MKVQATKRGYFGLSIVEEGAEFNIPDEPKGKDGMPAAFSKRWMKSLEAPAKAESQDEAAAGKKGKK